MFGWQEHNNWLVQPAAARLLVFVFLSVVVSQLSGEDMQSAESKVQLLMTASEFETFERWLRWLRWMLAANIALNLLILALT